MGSPKTSRRNTSVCVAPTSSASRSGISAAWEGHIESTGQQRGEEEGADAARVGDDAVAGVRPCGKTHSIESFSGSPRPASARSCSMELPTLFPYACGREREKHDFGGAGGLFHAVGK